MADWIFRKETFHRFLLKMFGGIDAVYTWVNGADPEFQRELRHYREQETVPGDPSVAGERRFRDSEELRYSIRSLEAHAPWINRVFLVTNGQTPSWLNRDHPRLRLVSHRAIFPDPGHLPTYNSLAIEAHLHRIPGLSRRYLYFNDDWFLGKPVSREDFMSPCGKPTIWVEPWDLPQKMDEGPLVQRWLAWNHQLLRESIGDRTYCTIPHTPILYDRARVKEVVARWRNEFEQTSATRFRSVKMAAMQVLYSHSVAANSQARIAAEPEDYQFLMFGPPLDKFQEALTRLKQQRPKFFAINDDWDGSGETKEAVLRHFLEDYFPRPSRFEKQPLANGHAA